MAYQLEALLVRLDRIILFFWIAILSLSLPLSRLPVQAQTDCTAYNQCAALQGEHPNKLNGPITYSFDEASLQKLPTAQAREDFKNRIIAAVTDWSNKTGITIT